MNVWLLQTEQVEEPIEEEEKEEADAEKKDDEDEDGKVKII